MSNFAQMKNDFDKARHSQPEEDENQFDPEEEDDDTPNDSILPDDEEDDEPNVEYNNPEPQPESEPEEPAAVAPAPVPKEEPKKPAKASKPAQATATADIRGNLVVSDGTEICCNVSGNVTCEGTLYLYGSVSGETRAEVCYLYGSAYGPITCAKLILHQGAKASGGVNAKVLEME